MQKPRIQLPVDTAILQTVLGVLALEVSCSGAAAWCSGRTEGQTNVSMRGQLIVSRSPIDCL